MKSVFKQIISDFHQKEITQVFPRTLEVDLQTSKIISIVGPRRAGKSSYMFAIMQELLDLGVDKTHIVHINFEDERINPNGQDLQYILDAYNELYPDTSLEHVYFFFDEIQNIATWDKFVRRVHDLGVKKIFVTGSNSKLLSKEIATSLRWRSLSYELLPLSFNEYVSYWFKWSPHLHASRDKAKLLELQDQYLQWGGFPEVLDFSEDLTIKTIQEYFDVLIYNDIVERYEIKNPLVLKEFVRHLLQSVTKEFSVNKIGNTLKSQGLSFDKNDLYAYLEYVENIYFAKPVSKYEYAYKKQTRKKIYSFDNGYMNALSFSFSDNWGKLLENAVFGHLYRLYGDHIFFLKNGSETDFVVNNRNKEIYQVCYDPDEHNMTREIAGVLNACKKFELSHGYIISRDKEYDIQREGVTIHVLPFYLYVLNDLSSH